MKRLNIGMPLETAIWLTGAETEAELERWKQECSAELGGFSLEQEITLTAPAWIEKRPGEDRVPPVPDHISGPNVRLLICEARVAGPAKPAILAATGFVADLDARDLARLRDITRRAHANLYPVAALLTDAQCDDVIERLGPDTALKTLRDGVDAKALH